VGLAPCGASVSKAWIFAGAFINFGKKSAAGCAFYLIAVPREGMPLLLEEQCEMVLICEKSLQLKGFPHRNIAVAIESINTINFYKLIA
jgi:hypothetical protein